MFFYEQSDFLERLKKKAPKAPPPNKKNPKNPNQSTHLLMSWLMKRKGVPHKGRETN